MANTLRRWWNAWREGLSWLPVLCAGLLIYGALQELDWHVLLWREALAALIPLALVGALCARSVANAVAETQVTPIRRAVPGYVAIRGKAQPIADRPLAGPESGKACVWYHHSYKSDHHFTSHESRRPFRLVDDTGEVLVMPADAEVAYGGGDGAEHLIEPGTELYVLGEFRSAANTPMVFTEPDSKHGRVSVVVTEDSEAAHEAARRKLDARLKDLDEPVKLPRLPCIVLPEDVRPFLISVEDRAEAGSGYRFLMFADLAIAAIGLAAFPFTRLMVLQQ
jgi:hypothetical protein